jgi:PGF-pre-PGF domain-containing protein
MRKEFSSMILMLILFLPTTLGVLCTTPLAEAAGNVTINDFYSNVTKGTAPLEARLYSNVTGNVTKWYWDFYNPRAATLTTVNPWSYSTANITTSHTFGRRVAAGVYGVFNVTLIVQGPDGYASLKKIDYVVANKNTTGLPNASFVASTTSGNAPLNVSFTDNSKNATGRIWYFGLRGKSTEKNPSFNFTSPGTYRAVLEVNNSRGWDVAEKDIIVGGQGGTLYPVADFDADTSNGLTVQFSDLSDNENKSFWTFGDGTNSTSFSPEHTYSAAGNYTVNLAVSNANGTNSTSKIISVHQNNSNNNSDNGGSSDSTSYTSTPSSSSSSSSSSGGGGGGGASPEAISNIEVKEISQAIISSGSPVIFDFPQKVTPVVNISFDSKKTAGKTTTIVELLKNQSILVSAPPSDEVYKNINIWVGSSGFATEQNIENAVVNFKVEKSWLQNNSVDRSSITLNRYNDSKWNALQTDFSGEDDTYLYFAAKTPGFSPFAITGKVGAQSQPSTSGVEQNNTSNTTIVGQTTEQAQSPAASPSGKENSKTPGFETAFGVISLIAVFLYKRK